MTAYQDHELLLMTSVVYSESFEVVDERKQTVCTLVPTSLWITFRVRFDFLIIRLFPVKLVD